MILTRLFVRTLQALRRHQHIPESQITELLASVDRSGDGRIDADEFVTMMLGLPAADMGDPQHHSTSCTHDGSSMHEAAGNPRHNFMTAKSGAWALSGVRHELPATEE